MARVKNNRKGIWSIGAYVVLPDETGILPNKDWADFKKSAVGKAMLKEGSLTEVEAVSKEDATEGDAVKPGLEAQSDLGGLNAQKAIDLVKNTNDLALLAQWEGTEKRTSVLQAITAQKAKIEAES